MVPAETNSLAQASAFKNEKPHPFLKKNKKQKPSQMVIQGPWNHKGESFRFGRVLKLMKTSFDFFSSA